MNEKKPAGLIKTILLVGPGVKIDPETVKLFEENDNGLLIGNGAVDKPLMWQEIIDKIDNRPFVEMPMFYIIAHGFRVRQKHVMQLFENFSITEDELKKIRELVGRPVVVKMYSCFGGSANKSAKALGEGSILITHTEAKEPSDTVLGTYSLHASLMRNFVKNLTPYQ